MSGGLEEPCRYILVILQGGKKNAKPKLPPCEPEAKV